ncbi:glycosyltransferase [Rhodopirellula sp. JC740]|uniref:Glycosyltransferase n=1 Tax=Rhodopirellula halodulae TaxID=2894198 RepID=A0ABS8NBR8_9BACT|nr:glycosyltransferase [Rhodopirellula sp. JC740]MCC9640869.1 glycosyltransferase [Rhodopirellula sp. JC740]
MSVTKAKPIDAAILPGSISRFSGGLFTSVRRLSESMNDQGIVRARVIGNQDAHTDDDISAWRDSPLLLKSSRHRQRAREVLDWLLTNEPDLVHPQFIWSYGSMATLRWVQANPSRRHIISPRGMLDPWAVRNSRWKKQIAGMLFEHKHLRKAACIHALCDSEAESIRKFGLKNPICVIPNGIDIPDDCSSVRSELVNTNLFGRRDDPRQTMLFVGRIHEKKGLSQLIVAWKIARDRLNDWRLVIAGWDDGGHQQELEKTVKDLELSDAVIFAGPIYGEAKSAALMVADAFILPSFSEGLPMSVLEAWAYRLPLLMTAQCNLRIGFKNECGVEIDTAPEKLARSLIAFADLPVADRRAMGESGRSLVEESFQWSTIASEMSEVYRWVLGQRDAPACVQF